MGASSRERRSLRRRGALLTFLLALLVGCGGSATQRVGDRPPVEAEAGGGLAVATAPSGESVVLEVAASPARRARGLQHRTEVPPGTGMLFLFDRPAREGFWMHECLVPLDIVWLDANGVVVDLAEQVPPCRAQPCPVYEPRAVASQVIEVAAGEARRLGMVPGARVLIEREAPR
jgi:hypothetical protein